MIVYLCPNLQNAERTAAARRVIGWLERQGVSVLMSAEAGRRLIQSDRCLGEPAQAELIISVGGDGTVLRAAGTAIAAGRPLMGVNSGRLGYLCAVRLEDLELETAALFDRLREEKRSMLSVSLQGRTSLALNDVVIARRRLAGTLSAEVRRGDKTLLRFRGDGLIIATPTGSTAYSRSAGGPVLLNDTGCFTLTPICAHTAGTAPLVVPDTAEYEVRVTDSGDDPADVLADGVTLGSMERALTVRKHGQLLRLLMKQ